MIDVGVSCKRERVNPYSEQTEPDGHPVMLGFTQRIKSNIRFLSNLPVRDSRSKLDKKKMRCFNQHERSLQKLKRTLGMNHDISLGGLG